MGVSSSVLETLTMKCTRKQNTCKGVPARFRIEWKCCTVLRVATRVRVGLAKVEYNPLIVGLER